MGTVLSKLAEEDPTFKVSSDQETGQTILAGMKNILRNYSRSYEKRI